MGKKKSRMDKIVEVMFEVDNGLEAHALASAAKTLAEKRFPAKKGGKRVRATAPQTES